MFLLKTNDVWSQNEDQLSKVYLQKTSHNNTDRYESYRAEWWSYAFDFDRCLYCFFTGTYVFFRSIKRWDQREFARTESLKRFSEKCIQLIRCNSISKSPCSRYSGIMTTWKIWNSTEIFDLDFMTDLTNSSLFFSFVTFSVAWYLYVEQNLTHGKLQFVAVSIVSWLVGTMSEIGFWTSRLSYVYSSEQRISNCCRASQWDSSRGIFHESHRIVSEEDSRVNDPSENNFYSGHSSWFLTGQRITDWIFSQMIQESTRKTNYDMIRDINIIISNNCHSH